MREIATFDKRFTQHFLRGVLPAFFLSAVFLLVTGSLTSFLADWDEVMRFAVRKAHSSSLTAILVYLTKLGSTLILTALGTFASIFFLVRGWARDLGIFLVAMAGQIILHHGTKAIFERPRPEAFFEYPIGDSYSFPSGHAIASTSFYIIVAWLFTRHMRRRRYIACLWTAAVALTLLIAFSRIYIGVHYLSDVLAGLFGGLIWAVGVIIAAKAASEPANRVQVLSEDP